MDIHGWRYTSFFFCFSVCVDSMRAHPHTSPTNIQETNWCHTMLLAVNGISEKVGVNLLFETYTLILIQSIHLPESTKANTFSLRIARIQKDMQASSEHTNEWALTVRSTHYSKNDGPLGAHESMIHQRGSVKLKKKRKNSSRCELGGSIAAPLKTSAKDEERNDQKHNAAKMTHRCITTSLACPASTQRGQTWREHCSASWQDPTLTPGKPSSYSNLLFFARNNYDDWETLNDQTSKSWTSLNLRHALEVDAIVRAHLLSIDHSEVHVVHGTPRLHEDGVAEVLLHGPLELWAGTTFRLAVLTGWQSGWLAGSAGWLPGLAGLSWPAGPGLTGRLAGCPLAGLAGIAGWLAELGICISIFDIH